jgi:hypothetical protein
VQAGFQVMVLALEADGVVDFLHVGQGQLAPDAELGRPGDAANAGGGLPGRAQVVELVVIDLRAATVAGGPGLGAICNPGALPKLGCESLEAALWAVDSPLCRDGVGRRNWLYYRQRSGNQKLLKQSRC